MTVEAVKLLCAGFTCPNLCLIILETALNSIFFLSFFFLTIIDIQTILSERTTTTTTNEIQTRFLWEEKTTMLEDMKRIQRHQLRLPFLEARSRPYAATYWDVRYLSRVRSWRSWRLRLLKRTIKLVIIFFPFRHRAMFQLHPMSRLWGSLVDVSLTSDTSVSHAMRSHSLYYLISSSETLEMFLKMFFCSKLMKYVSAIDSMFASQLIVLNWNDQLKISSEWNAKMNELLERGKERASGTISVKEKYWYE